MQTVDSSRPTVEQATERLHKARRALCDQRALMPFLEAELEAAVRALADAETSSRETTLSTLNLQATRLPSDFGDAATETALNTTIGGNTIQEVEVVEVKTTSRCIVAVHNAPESCAAAPLEQPSLMINATDTTSEGQISRLPQSGCAQSLEQHLAEVELEHGKQLLFGHNPDPEAAFVHLQSASEHHAGAASYCATMLADGVGVPVDRSAARLVFLSAAERGDAFASGVCVGQGWDVDTGKNTAPDPVSAIAHYERAVDDDKNPVAAFTLGACYLRGVGVDIDFTQAHKWYACAKALGYARAAEGEAYAWARCTLE